METKNDHNCGCDCDLSKCDLDMTIRQCLEKLGIDPNKRKKRSKIAAQTAAKNNRPQ